MAHRFGGERAPHQQSDVERLGDLGLGRALVEDLLDPMLDSVEAVLGDRHRERRQFLVLLGQRAVGKDHLAEGAEGPEGTVSLLASR
jgi:hypothetical protein